MNLQPLLTEPFLTLAYDHEHDWLYADWCGDQNLTTVQHGCGEMLRHLKDQSCHKVLNDNTRVTSMWSDAAEWGGREWFPAMFAAGLQYFAWVYSPDVYSRLSTDLTLQYTSPGPVIATFNDLGIARAWLAAD